MLFHEAMKKLKGQPNPDEYLLSNLLTLQPEGYLFSEDLRNALEPFAKMDIRECLRSLDFLKTVCKHAGISGEEFNELIES